MTVLGQVLELMLPDLEEPTHRAPVLLCEVHPHCCQMLIQEQKGGMCHDVLPDVARHARLRITKRYLDESTDSARGCLAGHESFQKAWMLGKPSSGSYWSVAARANIATPWQRDQRRIETIAKTEQLSDLLSLRK